MLKRKTIGERITVDEGEEITAAYRMLAATLLRYIRGGGDITQLRAAVLEAGRVTDLTQNTINGTMEKFVRPIRDWKVPFPEMARPALESTYAHLASGALQYVASRLDGDRAFQGRGETEMEEAIGSRLELWREEQAAIRTARAESMQTSRRRAKK